MQNTLGDLNNHLFAQLERLGEEDLKGEDLQEEISRARAVTDVATQIISNGALVLKAKALMHEYGYETENTRKIPPMLRASFLEE